MHLAASPILRPVVPNMMFPADSTHSSHETMSDTPFMLQHSHSPPVQLPLQHTFPLMHSVSLHQQSVTPPPVLPSIHETNVPFVDECTAPYFTSISRSQGLYDVCFEFLPQQHAKSTEEDPVLPEFSSPINAGRGAPEAQNETWTESASNFLDYWGELDDVQDFKLPHLSDPEHLV
jgi:hypothetical protein